MTTYHNPDRILLADFAATASISGVQLYCCGHLREEFYGEPYFELTEVFSCKESDNNLLSILQESYLAGEGEMSFADRLEDTLREKALEYLVQINQGR